MDQSTNAPAAPTAGGGQGAFQFTKAYQNYILFILFLVSLFNFVDRQIMAVLLEGIRQEFGFSDTQLGLIGGTAFAIFYAVLGIPVARLADKFNRRNILAIAVGLWSIMTAVGGLATGFVSLFLARVGVGVGEAGGIPTTHSLLADYFKRNQRGTALAIVQMGTPLGVLFGFLVGGWVNEFYGWRAALMAVGLPGVILAVVIRLTLREPPRGHSEDRPVTSELPSFKDTIRYLWSVRACRWIPVAAGFYTLGAWGSGIWLPSFFIRAHDMSSGEIGTWMALIFGLGGGFGAFIGGYLTDRIASKTGNVRWYMWLPSIALSCAAPMFFFVYLSPNATPALLVLIIPTILGHSWLGPATAMMQNLAGVKRRAMSAAVYQLVNNLMSAVIGPPLVGIASDLLSYKYGDQALGYSILGLVVFAGFASALCFLMASRTLKSDLENAQEE